MLLCTLACAGVGGALDDRVGAMDNDTDRTSTIHMNVGSVHYPRMINSGRSARQTVDDLVFNHFLIHSLGGGGWWRGHSNAAGAKPADAAGGSNGGGDGGAPHGEADETYLVIGKVTKEATLDGLKKTAITFNRRVKAFARRVTTPHAALGRPRSRRALF